MAGLIIDASKRVDYTVEKLQLRDCGKRRARIHFSRRDGAKRFQIVKITRCDNGNFLHVAALGLSDKHKYEVLQIDYDDRQALEVDVGQTVELEIRKAGFLGATKWFLTVRDPHIRISAWLAVVSLGLGLLSIILALA